MIVYLLGEPMPAVEARTLVGGREPVCVLHRHHAPRPLRLVAHHVLPVAHGGRTVRDNLAVICDTGHYNVHVLLGVLLGGEPLRGRRGAVSERLMARRGFELIQAGGGR